MNGVLVDQPKVFKGQLWPSEVINYYVSLESVLSQVKGSGCPISYQYNFTLDSFFPLISPFKQFQPAPYFLDDRFYFLTNNYDLKERIKSRADVILLASLPSVDLEKYIAPNGFYIFKHFPIPAQFDFLPPNYDLLILVPIACKGYLPL